MQKARSLQTMTILPMQNSPTVMFTDVHVYLFLDESFSECPCMYSQLHVHACFKSRFCRAQSEPRCMRTGGEWVYDESKPSWSRRHGQEKVSYRTHVCVCVCFNVLCMCICVCMYVNMYVYMYICIYIYIYIYICMYILMYMYMCICICLCICIYCVFNVLCMCICVCMYVNM
jgi:hypothetical protein